PKTSVEKIKKFLNLVDRVLVMSVNPGFGGQKFIESVLHKVCHLHEYRKKNKLTFEIDSLILKILNFVKTLIYC
ncbi:MAG: hypothetical protein ABIL05_00140, partial [candidate division WOR-3 bacterium]